MKKIVLVLLSISMILSACLLGCTKEKPSTNPPIDDATTDTKAEDNSSANQIPQEDKREENPASDFKWEENENGEIVITKYVGTDTEVVVPEQINGEDVKYIGIGCFSYSSIISVDFPNTVVDLVGLTFSGCEKLEKVVLPEGLQVIGGGAFQWCTVLKDVVLPSTLTDIYIGAFKGCTSLKEIHIPQNVTLHGETFVYSGLESVTFEAGFSGFSKNDFGATKIKQIVLPRGCKKIDYNSLCIGESLEEIVLNDDLEEIGSLAFQGNSNLKKIVIPSSVKRMGSEPFSGCTSLEEVLFEGDAPNLTDKREELFYVDLDALNYVVYHHKEAKGFTSPEWNEHQTKIW